jgi:hypothetical protein
MGTRASLSKDGNVVLTDGLRRVVLRLSEYLPEYSKKIDEGEPGERRSDPPAPAPSPPAVGAPKTPPRTSLEGDRVPAPTVIGAPKLPPRAMLVASFVPEDGILKESWGKSSKRTRKLVHYAAWWKDLSGVPTKDLTLLLAEQHRRVHERTLASDIRLNIFMTESDLENELDLDRVVSVARDLPVPMTGVRVFFLPTRDLAKK